MNADGFTDLYYSNHRVPPTLYLNNGDGTFSDRSDLLQGENPTADMHGAAWADIDNDGDQDLQVHAGGTNPNKANHKSEFFINNGTNLVEQNNHPLDYAEAQNDNQSGLMQIMTVKSMSD